MCSLPTQSNAMQENNVKIKYKNLFMPLLCLFIYSVVKLKTFMKKRSFMKDKDDFV